MGRRIRSGAARSVALGLAWLCAAGAPLAAQAGGVVHGRVVEAGSQRPLGGVQVSISAAGRGALTNASGDYRITGVPAGEHRVRAQYLGYAAAEQAVRVGADDAVRADFRLSQSAIALDELVVTGTPGEVQRRALGNAVGRIDAATVTELSTVSTVTEVLMAKTPGLTLLPNAGVPGAAADIRIRGAGSFLGNRPVVYVDGIRYNIESLGNFTPSGAGVSAQAGQATSGLDFINPNDIESIEVIRGPAAATLYGAEAAGGVIQIITKKGARGQQGTRWTARYETGRTEWALQTPVNYTTCTAARIAERDAAQNPIWPGCQGVAPNTIITGNPLRDDPNALRQGDLRRISLSARGGGDQYSFYVAGDLDDEQGVFHNSFNERQSARANFTFAPTPAFDFSLSSSYGRSHLRFPLGDEAGGSIILSAARGLPGRVSGAGEGWRTINPARSNNYDNQTRAERLTLGGTISYRPVDWFRNRFVLGVDYTTSLAEVLYAPGRMDDFPEGFIAQQVPRARLYTLDYAGNVIRRLPNELESTTSFGMQVASRRDEMLRGTGRGLGAPDVTLIGTATSREALNSFSEQNSLGYFAQQQLAWRNRLFVTGALRMDNNSVFGERIRRIVYPKASLSWVLSEEPMFERSAAGRVLDNLRLRAAWGQAGRAPSPYAAAQTYTVGVATMPNATVSALRTSAYGNPDLAPERGTEMEIGFDAALFGDRLGAELTYYDKRMRDVIVAAAVPGSTGFAGSRLTNLGETHNSGVELMLNATPVQLPALAWNATLTLSTNRNRLVDFGDGRTVEVLTGQVYSPGSPAAHQQHRPGYPLAGYWAQFPQRDEQGNVRLNPAGTAVLFDTATYVGSAVPTREIGISNSLTVMRNLRIYALFDYKGGHHLLNFKEYNRCLTANGNCWAVNDPNASDIDKLIARSVPAHYLERADFVKLRDLSATYTLPARLLANVRASQASVTLAGHNLALWSDYSGLDPEVNTYGLRSFVRVDAYAPPMTRRVSLTLNLGF